MARLIILAATLAVLLAISNASTCRTIVTTTVNESINNLGQTRRCRKQIQSRDLSDCEQYLTQGSRSTLPLLRRVLNQEPLERCCQQLTQLNRECRCVAVQDMARQIDMEEELQSEEKQKMLRRASTVTSKCDMESQCPLGE